jgi:signal transduction histidine kinase
MEEYVKVERGLGKAQSIAHLGYWEMDLSEKKVWISDEAISIYGFDNGCHDIQLGRFQISPLIEYRDMLDETLDMLLCYNEPYEAEFMIRRSDNGILRSVYSKAELEHVSDSEQIKVIGVIQDITDWKQAEEELEYEKERAEENNRLKTAFLQNISHEIRTPANAMMGFSTMLCESEIDLQSRKSYTEIIKQCNNQLLELISEIIDISNIEANRLEIFRNEINVNTTLKTLCDQFSPGAREKKIMLVCNSGLSDIDDVVVTDKTKLIQILSNLITNSIKFTDSGYIRVRCTRSNTFLEFSVTDTGIGIQQENQNRIFDQYYQVLNSDSRLYEGMGLGLSITKTLVELIGGKIWFISKPGFGTTFFFTIPYEKPVVRPVAILEQEAPEEFVFPVKKIILVAEDDESNFRLIKYFLAKVNAEIIRAGNGKEAVEKLLSGNKIDLILMDIGMPVMDGYTATRLIRETNQALPIIAQTAYAEDMKRAIECGCNGFISKPFDKKHLIRILGQFI